MQMSVGHPTGNPFHIIYKRGAKNLQSTIFPMALSADAAMGEGAPTACGVVTPREDLTAAVGGGCAEGEEAAREGGGEAMGGTAPAEAAGVLGAVEEAASEAEETDAGAGAETEVVRGWEGTKPPPDAGDCEVTAAGFPLGAVWALAAAAGDDAALRGT